MIMSGMVAEEEEGREHLEQTVGRSTRTPGKRRPKKEKEKEKTKVKDRIRPPRPPLRSPTRRKRTGRRKRVSSCRGTVVGAG
jgi:hypothetical protein